MSDISWRCFFCDFITSEYDEAAAHFGDRDDAEEFKPICKWWQRMSTEDERVQTMQDLIRQLNYERMENYSQDKKIGKLIGDNGELINALMEIQDTIGRVQACLEK